MTGHRLDASIASLRRPFFKFKFSSNSKKKNESLVETQCLRLTDAKTNAQNQIPYNYSKC
jgi:hypothetical protein